MSKTGGVYRVLLGDRVVDASLRGRSKQQHKKRILVGDKVLVSEHADHTRTVEEFVDRKSVLRRRTPGKARGVRDIAANIEQVVVVGSVREPNWNPHLIDRFLAVGEANRLAVILVANKVDLLQDVSELVGPYRNAGYSVIETSVPERLGVEELKGSLEGHTSLFTGPTGVGKSSLLNCLQPGLKLRTAEVSAKSGAGRHTTVAAEMHRFGTNGLVVDTPGLRDIGLWGLSPEEVAAAFPEIESLAEGCRFDECRHLEEPGCNVIEAVVSGRLASSRHESYSQLLDEAHKAARPWSH